MKHVLQSTTMLVWNERLPPGLCGSATYVKDSAATANPELPV
jgi:hypothetical protein